MSGATLTSPVPAPPGPGRRVGADEPSIDRLCPEVLARRATREDEVEDLVSLLLEHADPLAGGADAAARIALWIAVASLGDEHLWQDMRLGSRAELSALMARWFPALVARNHQDMKWKKFLYRELCKREDILICKSPSCATCSDQPICFGPEH